METRSAALAGQWYPGDPASVADAVKKALPRDLPADLGFVFGGIVPHAGWMFSGAVAARTYAAVGVPAPRTFVLFGGSHHVPIRKAAISPEAAWSTPVGDVEVDLDLGERMLAELGDLLEVGSKPHGAGENSLEVQIPFLAQLYPDAAILPVAVPATLDAVEFGRRAGRLLAEEEERVVVIGSTDLTHYGMGHYGFAPKGTGLEGHRWAKEENDRSFLDRLLAFDGRGAVVDAREKRNACGAGAAAAATEAARAMGATRARLLEHTTSWEVCPDGREPSRFVGYASIVYC